MKHSQASIEELLQKDKVSEEDLNKEDETGHTPLTFLASQGNDQLNGQIALDLILSLVEKGANIDYPNRFGKSPVRVAAETAHNYIVNQLLDLGAYVNEADQEAANEKGARISGRDIGKVIEKKRSSEALAAPGEESLFGKNLKNPKTSAAPKELPVIVSKNKPH